MLSCFRGLKFFAPSSLRGCIVVALARPCTNRLCVACRVAAGQKLSRTQPEPASGIDRDTMPTTKHATVYHAGIPARLSEVFLRCKSYSPSHRTLTRCDAEGIGGRRVRYKSRHVSAMCNRDKCARGLARPSCTGTPVASRGQAVKLREHFSRFYAPRKYACMVVHRHRGTAVVRAGSGRAPGADEQPRPRCNSHLSTPSSIGVEWSIAGDADHDGTAAVELRTAATGGWRPAPPLVRVDYNGANMFAGSVLFLLPDTSVRSATDARRSYGGGRAQTVVVATRPVPVPPSAGRTFHVVPGSGGGTGSAASPFEASPRLRRSNSPETRFWSMAATTAAGLRSRDREAPQPM